MHCDDKPHLLKFRYFQLIEGARLYLLIVQCSEAES